MEEIESPSVAGPVAAPKNISRNSLATWVIGVLAAVASFMFGQNKSLQAEIIDIWKDQVKETKAENVRLNIKLEDAQKQLSNCEAEKNNLRGQYSITAGKKKLVITPSEDGQIVDYEK